MPRSGSDNPLIRHSRHTLGDRVGVLASLVCAVHCALLPLAVALLPTLGLGVVFGLNFDQVFVVFATLLGVVMLVFGYRRHRAISAVAMMLAGLVLVWVSTFTALHEHVVWHAVTMVVGGLLIAAAHLLNMRLSASLASCDIA